MKKDINNYEEALGTVLTNENNIKLLFKHVSANSEDDQLRDNIYQLVGDIIIEPKQLKSHMTRIKQGRIGWKHPIYDNVSARIEEHDDFIIHPFEVVEGVLTCAKCGSNKTFNYAKATRASDEKTTVHATCSNCEFRWVE